MAAFRPRVAIVGLGYVGLPQAVAFAEAGASVVGLDINPERVNLLNAGISHVDDISSDRLSAVIRRGAFSATVDSACLDDATDIVICVPTPLTADRLPDMTAVDAAARTVAARLQPDQLVVLESSTYPGTTEELLQPRLEASGLRAGTDFALAFSPERIDPGSRAFTLRNTPKVVGGLTEACTQRAMQLYRLIVDEVVPVSSPRVAEMSKLIENTFRYVNISLINELSMICDGLGINVWEAIDAASSKPFGFMRFNPGPGVGGYCIPVVPFYLAWKAREAGLQARFIELAGEIDDYMPRYVVDRVARSLSEQQKSLDGSRILVLGVAYKANVTDPRDSPAITVLRHLIASGASVRYHDPHVPIIEVDGALLASVALTAEELDSCDCAVVLTDHDAVDYSLVAEHATAIVDTRNRIRQFMRVPAGVLA